MGTDGCNNHGGHTRVNHAGPCCEGVGCTACGCGNNDTCREAGMWVVGRGGGTKGKKWRREG